MLIHAIVPTDTNFLLPVKFHVDSSRPNPGKEIKHQLDILSLIILIKDSMNCQKIAKTIQRAGRLHLWFLRACLHMTLLLRGLLSFVLCEPFNSVD